MDKEMYLRNKPIVIKIVLVLFFSFWTSLAGATEYWVTFDGGVSTQNGLSYLTAWSWSDFLSSGNWSDSEDATKIDPGDTVYLSGTFNIGSGTSTIPGSGTSGNYIIIDGDDGVNPSATIAPTYGSVTSIYTSQDYLEFRDITFAGGSPRLIVLNEADYIRIHDCTINGNYLRGFYIQAGSSYVYIYNNTITSTNTTTGADGVKIHPNAASPAVSNVYVYNNTISDWNHTAIENLSYTGNAAVSFVYIYENYINLPNRGYGRAFCTTSVTDGNVHHVYIHHNYIDSMRTQSQISNADYIYVYYNIFYNALNCCANADDAGCTEAYSNCNGHNSLCVDVDDPWPCCTGAGTGSCTDKLYWGTGHHLTFSSVAYGDISYIHIYNNTFYKSAETALWGTSGSGNTVDSLLIKNNIIYDPSNASDENDDPSGSRYDGIDRAIYCMGDYFSNIEVENNMVYDAGDTLVNDIAWSGSQYADIEAFQSGSPSGVTVKSGNTTDNPTLTDPDNNDFTLQSGSPAINAGTNLDAAYQEGWNPNTPLPPNTVTTLNQNNYGANWEIGAYVYPGTANTAPLVNAGSDQNITLPAGAALDGTVTDDGLPDPPATVITTWSKQSGPGTVTFIDESAVDTTADFSAAGTYVLRLTADDSDLQTSDDITITVNGDATPPAKPTGLIIVE